MDKGVSLVELMISLTISTIIILAVYSMYSLFSKGYLDSRDHWYCMQSLRNALIQIDSDLKQCAFLLPQDLKIAPREGSLFIAGAPVTSSYPGLNVHGKYPPPYYSVIQSSTDSGITLDTIDVDYNNTADYRADLGIITDSGPYVISHGYSEGNMLVSLTTPPTVKAGDRSVPSVHYELKKDGLYRNAQLLAEAITAFDSTVTGKTVTILLTARHNGEEKSTSYRYELR